MKKKLRRERYGELVKTIEKVIKKEETKEEKPKKKKSEK